MAAKYKQNATQKRNRVFFTVISLVSVAVIGSYLWIKIKSLLYNNQSWMDPSWFDYFPFINDYLQPSKQKGTLTIFQQEFYTKLWASVLDDIQFVCDVVYNFILHLCEVVSSVLALFSVIVLVCVCLSVSLYKDTREKKKSRRLWGGKKVKEKNGLSSRNSHVCCEHQEGFFRSNKLWWKWLTLLVFLAMLLSIPWEFVRMYQSMVAEKVAQMQAGVPAECLPDQTVFQSMKAYLRWYLSWGQDPCLVYHKALIVDPVWQVSPLMVLSSAFSHCIVYPVELLFGGLGRAFRLFFSEIPAQWQPFMLIIIFVLLILTLVMAFGYRIHLPFFLKFEPKTPVYLRHKSRRDDVVTREKQNLQFSAAESQQSIESSQDTQYSQETQYSQVSQEFD